MKEDLKINMSFEEWYDKYEEEINIELAESGADREVGFDIEQEFEDRYEEYLRIMDMYKGIIN